MNSKPMKIFYSVIVVVSLVLQDGMCDKPTEQVVPADLTEDRDGITYLKDENEPYTGTITEVPFVNEGKARYVMMNGKKHGLQRLWHANGKLSMEYNSADGKREGWARTWHFNGTLATEEHYKNGLLSGTTRSWHDNGQLAYVGQYEKDVPFGYLVWFHENGRPKKTGFFRNDKPDGLWVEWDEEGKETSRKYFSAKEGKEITEKEWLLTVEQQSK